MNVSVIVKRDGWSRQDSPPLDRMNHNMFGRNVGKKKISEIAVISSKITFFFLRVPSVTFLISEPLEMVVMRFLEPMRPFLGRTS